MTDRYESETWKLRLKMADTPQRQAQLAVNEGMPHWMKFGGEPALPYDVDPCRRVYMLSGSLYPGSHYRTSPWRLGIDADCGRSMQAVRR